MSVILDEMPTKLIRKNPDKPLMVVTRATYLNLMAEYNKLLSEGESMMELIDVMDGTIRFYEQTLDEERKAHDAELDELMASTMPAPMSEHTFYSDNDYEPGKLKLNFTHGKGVELIKPKRRKKFAGATLEFDPIKRSFGLGFHFREVSD